MHNSESVTSDLHHSLSDKTSWGGGADTEQGLPSDCIKGVCPGSGTDAPPMESRRKCFLKSRLAVLIKHKGEDLVSSTLMLLSVLK